ncbi:shikimate kinase 1 [Quercus suber]|uniref:Shikimate kinase 1 n=1 Tax=Quercus suber TaxID=58331 RepID=A0AAW0J0I7_QUESU
MEAITTPQFSALTIGSKSIGRNENIAMVALNLNRRGRKDCVITISRKPNIQSRSFHLGLPHSCNHSQAPLLESGDCYTSFDEDWLLKSEALQKLSFAPRKVVATGGGAVVRPVNWKYMRQGITVFLDVPLDALARRIAAVGTDSRPLLHFESGDAYTKAFVGLFTLTKKRSEAYANADATNKAQEIASCLNGRSIFLVGMMGSGKTTVGRILSEALGYCFVDSDRYVELAMGTSVTQIFEQRDLATNLRLEDVSDITPTVIAIEALAQIEKFLRGNNGKSLRMYPY